MFSSGHIRLCFETLFFSRAPPSCQILVTSPYPTAIQTAADMLQWTFWYRIWYKRIRLSKFETSLSKCNDKCIAMSRLVFIWNHEFISLFWKTYCDIFQISLEPWKNAVASEKRTTQGKTIEQHGKTLENHGRSWKIMEDHGNIGKQWSSHGASCNIHGPLGWQGCMLKIKKLFTCVYNFGLCRFTAC